MRPNVRSPTRSPDDFENLGKAFEGIAGALHDGHPMDRDDIDLALKVAHELWPVRGGGRNPTEEDFEAARHACHDLLPLAAGGDMRACMALEKAGHHVGLALRWKSRSLESATPPGADAAKPWDAAHDSRAGIRRLDVKYARYAHNPVYLPL